MSKTLGVYPPIVVTTENIKDKSLLTPLQQLSVLIQTLRDHIREVVNFNRIGYVAQDAKPTPVAGAFTVWKDTDATGGNPTHFLVYNDGGTVVTFGSEETV